jgi:hypothetical protein
MYFAWLGLYTTLLIPASLFGIGAFIYGLATLPGSGTAYVKLPIVFMNTKLLIPNPIYCMRFQSSPV